MATVVGDNTFIDRHVACGWAVLDKLLVQFVKERLKFEKLVLTNGVLVVNQMQLRKNLLKSFLTHGTRNSFISRYSSRAPIHSPSWIAEGPRCNKNP